jgi:hypothetical protein
MAIGIDRRDVTDIRREDRTIELASSGVAADRQGAERVAVIREVPRDEMIARGLAALHVNLPRKLEGGLGRLRPARYEEYPPGASRRRGRQAIGEFLRYARREKRRVRIGKTVELPADRLGHPTVAVAKAGNGGAAGGIEVSAARAIVDPATTPRDGFGIVVGEGAMKDTGGVRTRRHVHSPEVARHLLSFG